MHCLCMVLATAPLMLSILFVSSHDNLVVGLSIMSKVASNVGWFIMWVQCIEVSAVIIVIILSSSPRYFIIIMIILSSSQDISHFNEELWSHNFRHSSSADLYDGTFCCGFGIFRIFSPLYKTFICRVNKKRCFPSSFLVVLVHLVSLLQALVNCDLDFIRD